MASSGSSLPRTTQTGRYIQFPTPPGVINLGIGQPSPRLLPMDVIAEAAAAQLRPGADPLLLQYNAGRGYVDVRRALAQFMTATYDLPVAAEELMITAGTSSALTFVSEVFARPDDVVVCEDPTYFLAHGVFESAGLDVCGVPVDAGGLVVEALEALLADGLQPAFVYCIPAFQNPTGVSLEPARARRLVELAQRHDFVIIADEPYVALRYADDHPGTLVAHDEGRGRVLSLGSFSKLLAPGLRLGWAHGAPALVERLAGHGALRSGGCLNPVVANLVHYTLDAGLLARHVETLREVFAERCRGLCAALREHAPALSFVEPRGGYFCWVDLGEGVDAATLRERATDVLFIAGSSCAVSRDLSRFARLSFSFYELDELEEGVRRLVALL